MSACTECGAVFDCPACEDAETQVRGLELELRRYRTKLAKVERESERAIVARRDGAVWQRILAAWLEAFPDKRPSAKGIKSARATAVFMRLEAGAMVEDWLDAIAGAKLYPYVVFGKRQRSGSRSDLADDLQHIAAISRDHEFEFLRDAGRAAG